MKALTMTSVATDESRLLMYSTGKCGGSFLQFCTDVSALLEDLFSSESSAVYSSAPKALRSSSDESHLYVLVHSTYKSQSSTNYFEKSDIERVPNSVSIRISNIGTGTKEAANLIAQVISPKRTVSPELEAAICLSIGHRLETSILVWQSEIRAALAVASLRSSDLVSFLYRAAHEAVCPFFDAEAASIFFVDQERDDHDWLVLGGTTGIDEIERRSIKRSDVRYPDDGKSYTSLCYLNKAPIVEDVHSNGEMHRNTYGESVKTIFNRAYVPLKPRDNLTNNLAQWVGINGEGNGLCGVLRIVNCHNTQDHRSIDYIDLSLLTFVGEVLSLLVRLYQKTSTLEGDLERATHGYTTDLLTMRIAAQTVEKVGYKFQELQLSEQTKYSQLPQLRKLLDHIFRACRNILIVQDYMSEQLLRVQARDSVQLKDERRVAICEDPYVSVFLRLVAAKDGMSRMFNRQELLIQSEGKNSYPEEFKFMPTILMHDANLYSIFRNVAENTIKYTPDTSTPTLDISWKINGHDIVFRFRDYSIGIDGKDERLLFRETYRGRRAQRMHPSRGNGAGLSLSRNSARAAKGDIWYRPPDEGVGTVFFLQLPIRKFNS